MHSCHTKTSWQYWTKVRSYTVSGLQSKNIMQTPSFLENHISQIPALQVLCNLGYTYLTPPEVEKERRGKLSNVILENILEAQLRKINTINHKGNTSKFSDDNIQRAMKLLREYPREMGTSLAHSCTTSTGGIQRTMCSTSWMSLASAERLLGATKSMRLVAPT